MKTEKEFENYLAEVLQYAKDEGFDGLDETFVTHLRCRFFHREVVIGRGENVYLREMRRDDLEQIYAFSGAETENVLKVFVKEDRKEAEALFEAYISNIYSLCDYGIWAVVRSSGKALIGLCGIGNICVQGEEVPDLGYYICPECRGRGYASEAVRIALDYAENYLEFPAIYAQIKDGNEISARVLEKFGFTKRAGSLVYKKTLGDFKRK